MQPIYFLLREFREKKCINPPTRRGETRGGPKTQRFARNSILTKGEKILTVNFFRGFSVIPIAIGTVQFRENLYLVSLSKGQY